MQTGYYAYAEGTDLLTESEELSAQEVFPKQEIIKAIKSNENPQFIEKKLSEFEKNLGNLGKDKDPVKVWVALWAIWYQHIHIQNSRVFDASLGEDYDTEEYQQGANKILKQSALLSAWKLMDKLSQNYYFSTWYPKLFPDWLPADTLNYTARRISNLPLVPFQFAERMGISPRYFFPYTIIYYLAEDAWRDYWFPDRRSSLDALNGEIRNSIQDHIEHGINEALLCKDQISKDKIPNLIFLASEWGSLSWFANEQLLEDTFNKIFERLENIPQEGDFNEINLRKLVRAISYRMRKNTNNSSLYLGPIVSYLEDHLE